MSESNKRASTSRHATKRSSIAPSAPKPPSTISPQATIAAQATLAGIYPITIAAHAVLAPHSRVVSAEGPVEIGDHVLLSEKSTVGPTREGGRSVLGRNVVLETGAVVEGADVGEGCFVDVYAVVGEGARLGKVSSVCHGVVGGWW
jgi:dynactin-6